MLWKEREVYNSRKGATYHNRRSPHLELPLSTSPQIGTVPGFHAAFISTFPLRAVAAPLLNPGSGNDTARRDTNPCACPYL